MNATHVIGWFCLAILLYCCCMSCISLYSGCVGCEQNQANSYPQQNNSWYSSGQQQQNGWGQHQQRQQSAYNVRAAEPNMSDMLATWIGPDS